MIETDPQRGGVRGPAESRAFVRDLGRLAERVLPVFALVVAIAFVLVAAAHATDRAFIQQQAGSRMGLAQYAREGILYPPLLQDGHYGGTRMMPIPVILHAGIGSLTDEFLVSGKLLTYVSFLALLFLAFVTMRSLGCSSGRSAALAVAVAATRVGLATSLTISYDALPVALQLGAVLLVARRRDRVAIATAGVVCAAALLSKLSALWAVGAVVVWLWRRDRSALGVYLGASVAAVGLGVSFVQLASGGRFAENVLMFSSSALGNDGILRVPVQLLIVATVAPAVIVLFASAVTETVLAKSARDLTIYHVSFWFAGAILLVVLTRSGAIGNHFLDLLVLCAVLTARLWVRWERNPSHSGVVPVAVVLSLIVSSPALGLRGADVVFGSDRLRADIRFLDEWVDPHARLLAEDPSIPVMRGQVPVVLDAFTLSTIGARHPELITPLIQRLERHEFDLVILTHPLDAAPKDWFADVPTGWYTVQLGAEGASAIGRDYVLLTGRERDYIYVPRDASS